MVEARIAAHVVEGPHGPALGVGGAKDAAVHSRVHHEAGAHEAGLQGHVHGAAGEPPAVQGLRGGHHGRELRVGAGVAVGLSAVVGCRHDLAVAHHHGADGHLALLGGLRRLAQGQGHEPLVLGLSCRNVHRPPFGLNLGDMR